MSDLFTKPKSETGVAVRRERRSEISGISEVQLQQPAAKEPVQKREFSDKKRSDLADKGLARPDGSYPIESAKDIENAVSDYYRTGGDPAVKAHIIQAAKKLGLTKSLPDDWQ